MPLRTEINELPLVDHHCHAVVGEALDDAAVERWISESDRPMTDNFETPLGFAILAWCAPLLGLAAHCSAAEYLARRREFEVADLSRLFLGAAGVSTLLIDTGITGAGLCSPQQMAEWADAEAREVVRIEAVGADAAARAVSGSDYRDLLERMLRERAADAVGLKSVAAYRCGLGIDWRRPDDRSVDRAAEEILRDAGPNPPRIADPILIAHGVRIGSEVAAELRLPIQFHTGLGDTDLDLDRVDPALLTPLIRDLDALGVAVTLLHCYPFQRKAAYLAAMFPNVYVDVGLALNHAAGGFTTVLGELMELTPFGKHLYSSDAIALPELHHLGSRLFRDALGDVLEGWVARGLADQGQATRVALALAGENAKRVYRL
jgi:predicted TIM-barrel fold metal-dependent hydrolase